MKGGGAEVRQRDQRCAHQGVVSSILLQGQRGVKGGVGGRDAIEL